MRSLAVGFFLGVLATVFAWPMFQLRITPTQNGVTPTKKIEQISEYDRRSEACRGRAAKELGQVKLQLSVISCLVPFDTTNGGYQTEVWTWRDGQIEQIDRDNYCGNLPSIYESADKISIARACHLHWAYLKENYAEHTAWDVTVLGYKLSLYFKLLASQDCTVEGVDDLDYVSKSQKLLMRLRTNCSVLFFDGVAATVGPENDAAVSRKRIEVNFDQRGVILGARVVK